MGKRLANGTALHTLSVTNARILAGEEDLTAWSDEEIHRGQRRDRNGRWSGRPPKVIPQAVHAERVRRTMTKAHELLRESTYAAVALLRGIVDDTEAGYPIRMQAASLILERTLPRVSENVNVNVGIGTPEPTFIQLLRKSSYVLTPGELDREDDNVIDVEWLDDEPGPEPSRAVHVPEPRIGAPEPTYQAQPGSRLDRGSPPAKDQS